MSRYIDADAMLTKAWNNLYECEEKWEKHFGPDFNIHGRPEMQAGFDAAHNAIINAPTADVAEVKHGRWVKNDNGTYSCNLCHSWIPNEQYHYARFCLYCGAKDRKSVV